MERAKDPNKGLISPPGGKLMHDKAESPFECAAREFEEECGIKTHTKDWTLSGIVTEDNYPAIGHILIFLMTLNQPVDELPEESIEGKFKFVNPANLDTENIPETDKLFIWKNVLNNNCFFSLKIDCNTQPFSGIIETA